MNAAAPVLLPPGVWRLSKRTRAMARQKFLRLLRHMRRYREDHGLLMRFLCATCQQPVQLKRGDGLIQTDRASNTVDPRKDVFTLECGCSIWTVGK